MVESPTTIASQLQSLLAENDYAATRLEGCGLLESFVANRLGVSLPEASEIGWIALCEVLIQGAAEELALGEVVRPLVAAKHLLLLGDYEPGSDGLIPDTGLTAQAMLNLTRSKASALDVVAWTGHRRTVAAVAGGFGQRNFRPGVALSHSRPEMARMASAVWGRLEAFLLDGSQHERLRSAARDALVHRASTMEVPTKVPAEVRAAAPVSLTSRTEVHDSVHRQPRLQLLPAETTVMLRANEVELLTASAEPLLIISGPPGVGKSVLASAWARSVESSFGDGQIWIDMRGYSSAAPRSAHDAMRRVLIAMGSDSAAFAEDSDDLEFEYKRTLARQAVLLIADNVSSLDQFYSLVPGGGASRVLVTSRHAFTGPDLGVVARRLELGPFESEDALRLARSLVGRTLNEAEEQALQRLIGKTHGLPFLVAHLATRASVRGAQYVDGAIDLSPQTAKMPGTAGETFATSLDASLAVLDSAARTLFYELATLPVGVLSSRLVDYVAGLNRGEAVDELVRSGILQWQLAGSVRLHDLWREHATTNVNNGSWDVNPRIGIRAALRELREKFAVFTDLLPKRQVGTCAERRRWADVVSWFAENMSVVEAYQRKATSSSMDQAVARIARFSIDFLMYAGEWDRAARMVRTGFEAARRCGDGQTRAKCLETAALLRFEFNSFAGYTMDRGSGASADRPLATLGSLGKYEEDPRYEKDYWGRWYHLYESDRELAMRHAQSSDPSPDAGWVRVVGRRELRRATQEEDEVRRLVSLARDFGSAHMEEVAVRYWEQYLQAYHLLGPSDWLDSNRHTRYVLAYLRVARAVDAVSPGLLTALEESIEQANRDGRGALAKRLATTLADIEPETQGDVRVRPDDCRFEFR